ncbi:Hybrid signal transduction histidine kinase [Niallia nealsonii AAU1]|nr:Hybrid signal transduction histidine kinase [Niallia nealsonii AAU1]
MKIKAYFSKSISRQFVALMCFFSLLFLIGCFFLAIGQKVLNDQYAEKRAKILEKTAIVQTLQDKLETALLDARGYFAFHNSEMRSSALKMDAETNELIGRFKTIATTDEELLLAEELTSFHSYYFKEILPQALLYFEEGETEKVIKISDNGGADRISYIKGSISSYIELMSNELNSKIAELNKNITLLQVSFLVYIILIMTAIYLIGRASIKKIGKPLADLSHAANEIAKGIDAQIKVDSKRADELGTLSVAFYQMYQSVQDKEQDLMAQNEELLAQQDELHAQQTELEEVLNTVQENKESLRRRNELINSISNSLYKNEVLESMIIHLAAILKADRGIILLLKDRAYASYGIVDEGAEQFKNHVFKGMLDRLKKEKDPFIITREMVLSEKGYHLEKGYTHDLYIPVYNSDDEITAVMMLSRFSDPFSVFDKEEFIALAKQISISLDKIELFEQTENDRVLNHDILNTLQEGIQVVCGIGEIILVNDKFEEIVGESKETIFYSGCGWDEWKHQLTAHFKDEEGLLQYIEASIQEKQNKSYSAFMKDGRVINIYAEELYRGDVKFGTILVYRDITKEYEVDRMKSEFVSTVSHELRTPLASILGFTELMINRELKVEKQKKYLQTIYGEAKRLTSLINDFLDIQRMEAGKQTYEKKNIDLLPILERVKDNLSINTPSHIIQINQLVEETMVIGDKAKMEQVMANLLSNAIKYSPNGGKIEINIYKELDQLRVAFKDEGLGIPETAMDKLFTKFYRVDNTDRRKIGGTGLGLSIVQEIMNAHDGKVMVESEYGKGSTLTLVFPLIHAIQVVRKL